MKGMFQITISLFPIFLQLSISDIIDEDLHYERLEFLGTTCYPKDTCNSRFDLSFDNRTCECDSECHIYKDCCIDAEHTIPPAQLSQKREFECLTSSAVDVKGVYVIAKCNRNFRASEEIREKCELPTSMTDPWASAPATDISRNVTYKNRYCAECNNANPRNLRTWQLSIECATIPDKSVRPVVDSNYVKTHLTYETSGRYANEWGFYHRREGTNDQQFYSCAIPYLLPEELHSHVRYCRAQEISSCPSSWNRRIHHEMCKAYLAVIFVNGMIFRNPDCAYCNRINLTAFTKAESCNIPKKAVTGRAKKPALSFALILDVNLRDGEEVGKVARCPSRHKWDPFFNKCRKLICALPGYVMRRNACVKP